MGVERPKRTVCDICIYIGSCQLTSCCGAEWRGWDWDWVVACLLYLCLLSDFRIRDNSFNAAAAAAAAADDFRLAPLMIFPAAMASDARLSPASVWLSARAHSGQKSGLLSSARRLVD